MDTTTRRAFLGKALLSGVGTAIGTTLGSPFSSALAQPTDDQVSDIDPNFIAGKIIESLGEGVYVVHDSNEQDRLVRTTSATRVWRRGRFNQTLQVGDCTYIRGELDQGGVLDVDRLWVDIQSYSVDVAEVRPGRLGVTLASNDLPMTVDVTSLTLVQNEDGSFTRGGDIAHIGVGDVLQVIGFGDEPFTATRLFLLSGTTSASNPDEDVIDIIPDPLAPGNCLFTY